MKDPREVLNNLPKKIPQKISPGPTPAKIIYLEKLQGKTDSESSEGAIFLQAFAICAFRKNELQVGSQVEIINLAKTICYASVEEAKIFAKVLCAVLTSDQITELMAQLIEIEYRKAAQNPSKFMSENSITSQLMAEQAQLEEIAEQKRLKETSKKYPLGESEKTFYQNIIPCVTRIEREIEANYKKSKSQNQQLTDDKTFCSISKALDSYLSELEKSPLPAFIQTNLSIIYRTFRKHNHEDEEIVLHLNNYFFSRLLAEQQDYKSDPSLSRVCANQISNIFQISSWVMLPIPSNFQLSHENNSNASHDSNSSEILHSPTEPDNELRLACAIYKDAISKLLLSRAKANPIAPKPKTQPNSNLECNTKLLSLIDSDATKPNNKLPAPTPHYLSYSRAMKKLLEVREFLANLPELIKWYKKLDEVISNPTDLSVIKDYAKSNPERLIRALIYKCNSIQKILENVEKLSALSLIIGAAMSTMTQEKIDLPQKEVLRKELTQIDIFILGIDCCITALEDPSDENIKRALTIYKRDFFKYLIMNATIINKRDAILKIIKFIEGYDSSRDVQKTLIQLKELLAKSISTKDTSKKNSTTSKASFFSPQNNQPSAREVEKKNSKKTDYSIEDRVKDFGDLCLNNPTSALWNLEFLLKFNDDTELTFKFLSIAHEHHLLSLNVLETFNNKSPKVEWKKIMFLCLVAPKDLLQFYSKKYNEALLSYNPQELEFVYKIYALIKSGFNNKNFKFNPKVYLKVLEAQENSIINDSCSINPAAALWNLEFLLKFNDDSELTFKFLSIAYEHRLLSLNMLESFNSKSSKAEWEKILFLCLVHPKAILRFYGKKYNEALLSRNPQELEFAYKIYALIKKAINNKNFKFIHKDYLDLLEAEESSIIKDLCATNLMLALGNLELSLELSNTESTLKFLFIANKHDLLLQLSVIKNFNNKSVEAEWEKIRLICLVVPNIILKLYDTKYKNALLSYNPQELEFANKIYALIKSVINDKNFKYDSEYYFKFLKETKSVADAEYILSQSNLLQRFNRESPESEWKQIMFIFLVDPTIILQLYSAKYKEALLSGDPQELEFANKIYASMKNVINDKKFKLGSEDYLKLLEKEKSIAHAQDLLSKMNVLQTFNSKSFETEQNKIKRLCMIHPDSILQLYSTKYKEALLSNDPQELDFSDKLYALITSVINDKKFKHGSQDYLKYLEKEKSDAEEHSPKSSHTPKL